MQNVATHHHRDSRLLSRRLPAALWVAVLAMLTSAPGLAQISGLQVRSVTSSPVNLPTRKPLTLSFVVSNQTGSAMRLADFVQASAGIRVVYDEGLYLLAPGDRAARLVTIIAPGFLEAGLYDVSFQLRQESGRLSAPVTTSLDIPAVVDFEVQRLDQSAIVRAGEIYEARFSIENRGNTTLSADLTAHAPKGLVATPNVRSVILGPASKRSVSVSVPIPEDWRSQELEIGLDAVVVEGGNNKKASAVSDVNVLFERGPGFAYHRYPLIVGSSAGITTDPLGFQDSYARAEARGSGLLREGGQSTLSFDVLSPTNTGGFSSLSRQDRYLVELGSPLYQLSLGDISTVTSRIAGGGAFGFGGAARLTLKRIALDAYRTNNRYTFEPQREIGGGISLKPIQAWEVGVRFADRLDPYAPGSNVSLSTVLTPFRFVTLKGEYGVGQSPDLTTTPRSTAVGFDLALAGVSLRGRMLHADAGYPSSQTGRSTGNASLNVSLPRNLRLESYYFFGRFQSLSQALGADAPVFASHTGSAALRLGGASRLRTSIRYDVSGNVSAGGGISRNAWQHLGIIELSTQFGTTVINVQPGAGVSGPAGGPRRPVYGGALQIGTRLLSNRLSFSAHARHFEGPFGGYESAVAPLRNTSGSLSSTFRPGSATSVSIRGTVTKNRSGENWSTGFSGQTELEQRLPWGHMVSLAGIYSGYSSARQAGQSRFWEVAFTYRIPLRIPLHRSGESGLVAGQLVDGASGSGLEDTAVFLGSSATLTGKDGRFFLPLVESGPHDFRLAFTDSQRDYVLKNQVPYSVRGGRRQIAELIAVPAAKIAGTISVTPPGEGSPAGIGLRIRLLGEDVERIAIADGEGRFQFRGLPDGNYEVQIVPESVGSEHRVQEGSVMVHLGPAEVRPLEFVLQTRRSLIQFQPLLSETEPASAETAVPAGTAPQEAPPVRANPPKDHVATDSAPRSRPAFGALHRVRTGDTLRNLSRIYFHGDSERWSAIFELNRSVIEDANILPVGADLLIPVGATSSPDLSDASGFQATSPSAADFLTHVVRPGDTLRSLARLYFDGDARQWTVLFALNERLVDDPNVLRVGLTLRIPSHRVRGDGPPPTVVAPTLAPSVPVPSRSSIGPAFSDALRTHVVGPGDTLRSLARLYFDGDASRWTLIYDLNKALIAGPNVLVVGTALRIPPARQ